MFEMARDLVRRITADYTEEEYRAYLEEGPLPVLNLDSVKEYSTPEEFSRFMKNRYSDYIDAYLESHGVPKGKNSYTVPEVKGTESNKDIACLLSDVAQETGYEDSFLWGQFAESVHDLMDLGETFFEARKAAFESVATISYEQDW